MGAFWIAPCAASPEVVGAVSLPASKSILNRLLVLGALSSQRVTLNAASWGEDTFVMLSCLQQLGFSIDFDVSLGKIHIQGLGGYIPNAKAFLDFSNAGTVARFIVALISLRVGGEYHLDGSSAMRARPISFLLEALERVGVLKVNYIKKRGFFPCVVSVIGTLPGKIRIDATQSSQGVSALMLIGFLKGVQIHFGASPSLPFVGMTARLLQSLGVVVEQAPNRVVIEPSLLTFKTPCHVPLDASAASYFGTWAFVTQRSVLLKGYYKDGLQGDHAFLELLSDAQYIQLHSAPEGLLISPTGFSQDIHADFKDISDTFISLAAISPLLGTSVHLWGLQHTRYQECNRLEATQANLIALGQKVEISQDAIHITPDIQKLKKVDKPLIKVYNDHRLAMGFGVLGSYDLFNNQKPWLGLDNSLACHKTFPLFFENLNAINYGR